MATVRGIQCDIQTTFNWNNPVNNLSDGDMAKLVVFIVQNFKNENPHLLKKLEKDGPGHKFKYELLSFIFICNF